MSTPKDPNFYFEGYNCTFRNATNLLEASDQAAISQLFGVARSLNVLACEELIKAFFLITKHYFPTSDLQDFDQIFRDHLIKHKHLKMFVEMTEKLRIRTREKLTTHSALFESVRKIPDEQKVRMKDIYESTIEELDLYKKISEEEIDLNEILIWLNNANNIKNQGLYVGLRNDKWTIPDNATSSEFQKERTYSNQIIQSLLNSAKTYFFLDRNRKMNL